MSRVRTSQRIIWFSRFLLFKLFSLAVGHGTQRGEAELAQHVCAEGMASSVARREETGRQVTCSFSVDGTEILVGF